METRNSVIIKYRSIVLFVVFFLLWYTPVLEAQDLSKEVYVVSSYRPEIADVDKISNLPLIIDTFSFDPKVEYTVLPSRIKSDYTLRKIKPAKMVGTPLDKLYNSHLKLGFGNYTTPLVEYSIQNLRSKEYAVGAYIFHKSSYHKVEPREGTKIPAGYGKNELSAYGKKFYRDMNLEAEIGADRHKIRHYGLNVDLISDPFEIETDEIKQAFNDIYAKAGIRSTQPDSAKMAYQLFLTGSYLWDHFDNREPHFNVDGAVTLPIKSFQFSLDANYDYLNFKNSLDTAIQHNIGIHPFLSKRKEEWSVNIGARVNVVQSALKDSVYVYPDVNFQFHVVDKILSAVVGVSGYLEQNSYQNLRTENPFIVPGITAPNTNHSLIAFFGLQGYLSRKASYRFNLNWEAMEDMLFYANSDTVLYENQFDIITNNADRIRYHFEFNWAPYTFLIFFIKTNYYSYTMYGEAHPWHRPKVDLNFTTRYNFKEKMYAELDFIALGKRYAKNNSGLGDIELDPVYDLNLKLEYKYSNILSIFLNFYNLTNQKHYFWNQYESQGINILGGVSYKF